jgi:excisionase family DNA binding protein
MSERMLTTSEVAARLGVTPNRVWALIKAGRLPSQQFGRDHLIKESDVALVADRKPGRPKKAGDGETVIEEQKAAGNKASAPTARLRKANVNTAPASTPITAAEIRASDTLKELLDEATPKKKKTRRSRRGGKGKAAKKFAAKEGSK